MSPTPTRRGLLRGLLAALLGWGGARPAAVAPAPVPPPCAHRYDGVLWAQCGAGRSGYYVRSPGDCPFCATAAQRPDPLSEVAAHVDDGRRSLISRPSTTTLVYDDAGGHLLGAWQGGKFIPGPVAIYE
jgi:hypothetical protein